jgi:hypothetical protein
VTRARLLFGVIASLALFSAPRARAEEADYELVRGPAPSLKSGQKVALSLSVVPRAGHRLLADGPLLVRLTGDGVRPARALYQRDEAVDPRADVPRFELALTAERKGAAVLTAHCTFYLCKNARCRPVETTATWDLNID